MIKSNVVIEYCLYSLGLWKAVLCHAKAALLDIRESRETFTLPLPCDECSSRATFKGAVNVLYWIVQIHCIANLGNVEVTALLFFPPAFLEDVSLLF